jgi:hypothetical protein
MPVSTPMAARRIAISGIFPRQTRCQSGGAVSSMLETAADAACGTALAAGAGAAAVKYFSGVA